jgi:hypothetical protein
VVIGVMPFEWDVKVSSKVSPVATLVFQRAGLSRARYTTLRGTTYCLAADRFTAHSAAELARASYGWPFNWVTQDLSRYAATEFPVTIAFSWQRNWSDPVVTSYDWLMFAVNTLLVGVPVTVLFYAIVFFSKGIAAHRKCSA